MPSSKEQKSKIQFDKWSEDYDHGSWSWYFRKSYIAALEIANNHIDLRNKTVVDLGCGTGELSMLLSNTQKTKKVYGIDISSQMINKANKKLQNTNSNVEFICSSASDIPLNNSSTDVIFLLNSLHHHHDPTQTLKEFSRVLKPGGVGIVLDPHRDGLLGFLWSNVIKVLFNEFYVDYYTSKQIAKFAKNSGMEILEQKYFMRLALISVLQKPNA